MQYDILYDMLCVKSQQSAIPYGLTENVSYAARVVPVIPPEGTGEL